ncbi:glycosyltransferase family 39 protein [Galbibacter sp. BG1]|uniref:ArnT family glycosyltransferase n=1 Tax=Galbibacter sp. BG1 TaxID=1170699 RepID=UPI0015BB184D|nr:glycosyltransferase family 39 protein [Galbibacter sp. BG1]QLE01066.1 glycosyltransferase family 39 protein [Galbibacter sp. BG1]
MMSKALSNKIIFLFILATIVVNIIQSAFTGLIFDEAYYWYFAQDLSWGYFDHPPMVALLVNLGINSFDGELGVRLLAPFLYGINVLLLWQLLDDDKKYKYTWLFIAFVSSVGLMVAYGFMMLPDTALVTSSLVFLWAYKRFLSEEKTINILLLGFSMAAVMYSKYHGVLLIGFVVLSNLNLFKRAGFWLATVFALLLYTPHLFWLYQVDFVPLKYHLFDRADSAYRIKFTLDYLVNCIAVAGLAFPLMYWAFFKVPSKNLFDKALKYLGIGVFIFFLFSSFSRKTQAQWVILMVIPLILFSLRYAYSHSKYRKWLLGISVFSVVLICFLRVALIYQPISPIKYEAYGNKEWVKHLQAQVKDAPVVFHNSYRDAAMYGFYSGGSTVFASNDLDGRQNQFSLDSSEFKVRNKKVAFITGNHHYLIDSTLSVVQEFKTRKIRGTFINPFKTYKRIKIDVHKEDFKEKVPSKFSAEIYNPYPETIPLDSLSFAAVFYDEYKRDIKTFPLIVDAGSVRLKNKEKASLQVKIPDTVEIPEVTYFRMGILNNGTYPGFQGSRIKLEKN